MVKYYDDYYTRDSIRQRTIVNRVFILLVAIGLIAVSFSFNAKINCQQDQYQVLSEKHDELVAKLSASCPGGAYIVEPIETEEQLDVDDLEVLDIAKLFGDNVRSIRNGIVE